MCAYIRIHIHAHTRTSTYAHIHAYAFIFSPRRCSLRWLHRRDRLHAQTHVRTCPRGWIYHAWIYCLGSYANPSSRRMEYLVSTDSFSGELETLVAEQSDLPNR